MESTTTDVLRSSARGAAPSLPALAVRESRDPANSLATAQVDAMVAAWRRGERPRAEVFLSRHPELGDEAAIRLIFEECALCQEVGLPVDRDELARRFPRWAAELELLLDCRCLIDGTPPPIAFPSPGDALAEFRLLAELGRGVSGRVFLAIQPTLARRPVVLKVSARGRDEHLSLAQLQHMNIVPLYSAQVLSDRGLQVLCMPFLGGASLAQILEQLKDQPPEKRSGSALIGALDRIQGRLPVSVPVRGPFRQYIAAISYVDAICVIGACLADGLQYAHDRRFVHMDIKPSNVLIAGDGQPMLLDFHVAREPIVPGDPAPTWMGGTPEYMPPEQAEAMAAVREGRAIVNPVDGRADVFALGLLLYEALGGPIRTPVGGAVTPLHQCNPQVSVGLSDIVTKCLRQNPRERYLDAAAVAADLRRHLEGLPLRGVANRSLSERWRKWRRRRVHAMPRSLLLMVAMLPIVAIAVLLITTYRQQLREVQSALADGRASVEHHEYAAAARALKQGLTLAERVPGAGEYRRALKDELNRVFRNRKAAELHELTELVRFRHGIDPPPADEASALLNRGRAVWQSRDALLRVLPGRREPELEQRVRADLLDFALVWASLRVRTAPAADANAARREAVGLLDEAAMLLGPSPALERERAAYAKPLGLSTAQTPAHDAPVSAWDHYELGRSFLRSGEIERAAEQFQRGLALRPQDFWLNFDQGLCAYRLGRHDEAVSAFRVCVALSPNRAECFYNRALALAALGRRSDAIDDYTRALAHNLGLSAALLNRGVLLVREGRHDQALADLRQALDTASGAHELGIIHYNLALLELARGDRPAALASLQSAQRFGHAEAHTLAQNLLRATPRP
jgi:serine/threonine protein kinase/Flp pilus assembly protein TadD